jgi:hypothetical protein
MRMSASNASPPSGDAVLCLRSASAPPPNRSRICPQRFHRDFEIPQVACVPTDVVCDALARQPLRLSPLVS